MPDAGDSLAQFRLVERIGEGDVGEVWKAVDTGTGREVAIRLLPPKLVKDAVKLERLREDSKKIAALDHPNVVPILSVEESDGTHFFSTDLVRGTILAQLVPSGGLTLEKFIEWALPLADALGAAHGQGVVHGDLKPGNVMADEDGKVKILDFALGGIQQRAPDPAALDTDDIPTLTMTVSTERSIHGVMPYLTPEHVQGKPIDARSDIFSLGSILYEMATGQRPFGGESPADIIVAVLRDQPRPVSELNGALPARLDGIIARCIEKDRTQRYQTAQELHSELGQL